jgi:hypothetical protein
MVVSVVDRPRYGLVEHSDALVNYLRINRLNAISFVPAQMLSSCEYSCTSFSIRKLFSKDVNVVVIWSLGITMISLPFLRIFGKKIIFISHEPGGIRQRLRKSDGIMYSLKTSIFESLSIFANIVVTPNIKNATNKIIYAPLLFNSRITHKYELTKKKSLLVYLGRKDSRRCYNIFCNFKNAKNLNNNIKYAEFPYANKKSFADKKELMVHAFCVMNIYLIKHNQSGVTPDALSFGVPVIVSELDAYSEDINKFKAGIVLSEGDIDEESIKNAIYKIYANFNFYSNNAAYMFDQRFGEKSFNATWLPLIHSLLEKAKNE